MVALTNEHAGSDGDIFSHGFKLMQIGPLVGTRTWGGVIGIWPRHTLVDGTETTQPEFSFWFKDVGWGVENYGTDPDDRGRQRAAGCRGGPRPAARDRARGSREADRAQGQRDAALRQAAEPRTAAAAGAPAPVVRSFPPGRAESPPPLSYLRNSGEISRGSNSATSGQMMTSASTRSIGISMIIVSFSASITRIPATWQAIIRHSP